MKPLAECLLYGILDLAYADEATLPRIAREMADGGVDIVQLRAKEHAPDAILRMARRLGPPLAERAIPFILNDHPQLVAEAAADGCHVGQDDQSVAAARAANSAPMLVGKSTHSVAQALAGADEAADYLGFGPLFATPTKPDYQPIGTGDIRSVHQQLDLPVFCIGGVKRENVDGLLAAGAMRVVIVSGILQAADIAGYCRDVKDQLVANFALSLT